MREVALAASIKQIRRRRPRFTPAVGPYSCRLASHRRGLSRRDGQPSWLQEVKERHTDEKDARRRVFQMGFDSPRGNRKSRRPLKTTKILNDPVDEEERISVERR